jgi:creatinine amidohydrolase
VFGLAIARRRMGVSKMQNRFWADYSSREIAAMDKTRLIAVLPVGAIEQHGPHLPVSVDQAILDGIIRATLPLLPADLPALFLPTLPIGKSDEHSAYPGTLTLTASTLMAMWTDIGDSLARAGVQKLVLLNSHGGQMAPMDIVVREMRRRHGMMAVAASWFAMGLPEGQFDAQEDRFGIHAGDMETSVMLALHPEKVRMDLAADFQPLAARLASENRHLGLGPAGRLGWLAQDQHTSGACGNAANATAEKGRAVIAHAAAQIVTLLQEVDRLPMSVLSNAADPDSPL